MDIFNRLDVVEGYTIQNLIKKNRYTETYRVEDKDATPFFLKVFSLKHIPPKMVNGRTGVVREIEYALGIRHRNVACGVDHGAFDREEGSYQYYITPYFNGQILADRLATQGKFEEQEALLIFRGILQGLEYLHKKSPTLCHNDLDTSNVILSEANGGEAVIIDFGHLSVRCCGVVDFDTSDLNPLFHANETRVNIFDEQGDIFSATAILYTLVVGIEPWLYPVPKTGSYKERFEELVSYRKETPLKIDNLKVGPTTKRLLERGLQIKSQDRFKSIREMIELLEGEPNETAPAVVPTPTPPVKESKPEPTAPDPNEEVTVHFEIQRGGGNGFRDIAGMESLKSYLHKQVIFVLKEKEMAEKYRLTPPNGMLLYGPPGCGKSFFAEKFAEETQFNFLLIKASDLGSTFVHGSQQKINKLFRLAEQHAPIVLCFDEFDAFVPDRSNFGIQSQAGEVNEFLSQMNNCSKRGIFIVATSNRPDRIDPAVLRTGRIDKCIYVPLPDAEARTKLFAMYLNRRPAEEKIDPERLSSLTEGYIASDIAYIVNDAAMTAAYAREVITQELLEESIRNTRPSVGKEALESYERIRQQMENQNRANNIRVTIEGLK